MSKVISLSVLVVDDVPDWRNMLAGLIRDLCPNSTIFTVSSVDEAKQCLRDHEINLAVIEVRLDELDEDDLDGLLLMEYICQYYDTIKTILITEYADTEMVRRALRPDRSGKRPALDFIQKSRVHLDLVQHLIKISNQANDYC